MNNLFEITGETIIDGYFTGKRISLGLYAGDETDIQKYAQTLESEYIGNIKVSHVKPIIITKEIAENFITVYNTRKKYRGELEALNKKYGYV